MEYQDKVAVVKRTDIYENWNPWHGCTKVSPGCKYCYVYRQDEMYGSEVSSSECRKTGSFYLPVKRKRDKSWKIESGKVGGESGQHARTRRHTIYHAAISTVRRTRQISITA